MRTDTVWTKTYERPWIVAAIAAGTVATLFLLFAPRAEAQYGGEIRGDRQELHHDQWDRNGDWTDVRLFDRQLQRLVRAERVGDRFEERRARAELQRLMRLELMESRRDLRLDQGEARWDRDDTGARWDDRRDARATRARLARERRVVHELASIETNVSRGAPWALDRERRLLREFSRLTREDALASGRELREDRRELWNDLRDDRDEGRRDFGGDGDERSFFKNDRPAPPPPPQNWNRDQDDREGVDGRSDQNAPPDLDRQDEDRTPPPPPDDEDAL
ncbi:MAG TPA: hypothetical protein VFR25_00265 [Candidatus Eisenbacteria bacterium]|nr:hypothetical protein [Candidatus Eisenbacteria bacterium]